MDVVATLLSKLAAAGRYVRDYADLVASTPLLDRPGTTGGGAPMSEDYWRGLDDAELATSRVISDELAPHWTNPSTGLPMMSDFIDVGGHTLGS